MDNRYFQDQLSKAALSTQWHAASRQEELPSRLARHRQELAAYHFYQKRTPFKPKELPPSLQPRPEACSHVDYVQLCQQLRQLNDAVLLFELAPLDSAPLSKKIRRNVLRQPLSDLVAQEAVQEVTYLRQQKEH